MDLENSLTSLSLNENGLDARLEFHARRLADLFTQLFGQAPEFKNKLGWADLYGWFLVRSNNVLPLSIQFDDDRQATTLSIRLDTPNDLIVKDVERILEEKLMNVRESTMYDIYPNEWWDREMTLDDIFEEAYDEYSEGTLMIGPLNIKMKFDLPYDDDWDPQVALDEIMNFDVDDSGPDFGRMWYKQR